MFERQIKPQQKFTQYPLGLVDLVHEVFESNSPALQRESFSDEVDIYPLIELCALAKFEEMDVEVKSNPNQSTNFFDPVEWWVRQVVSLLRHCLKESEYKLLYCKALGLAEHLERKFLADLTQAQETIQEFVARTKGSDKCQRHEIKNFVCSLRGFGVRAPDPSVIESQSSQAKQSISEYIEHQAPEWLMDLQIQEGILKRIELFSNLAESCFVFWVAMSEDNESLESMSFLKIGLTYNELSKLSTLTGSKVKFSNFYAMFYSPPKTPAES